jgi:hypothetical protein
MTVDLNSVIKQIAVDIEDRTVLIELICSSELGARVLFEDVVARMESDCGLSLKIKAKRETGVEP